MTNLFGGLKYTTGLPSDASSTTVSCGIALLLPGNTIPGGTNIFKILDLLSDNITTLSELIVKSSSGKIVKGSKSHQIFVKRTIKQFIINHLIHPINLDGKLNETLELDKVGNELAKLVRGIKQYRMSYARLINAIRGQRKMRLSRLLPILILAIFFQVKQLSL
jgi:hypothetical protein